MEAVIPAEVLVPSLRTTAPIDTRQNSDQLRVNLDLSEEQWLQAQIRITSYQQRIRASYNRKMKSKDFQVGDFVLRQVTQTTRELNAGKLDAKWEGPYRVVGKGGKGSYTLVNQEGEVLQKQWNVAHLRMYYM